MMGSNYSPPGAAPSARDIAEVAAGTGSADDRAEVAAARAKHPKSGKAHRMSKGRLSSSAMRRKGGGKRR